MVLTLSRCEEVALHSMRLDSFPPAVSVLELVDRAGSWLCSHPWTWLERIGTVTTTASQEYVSLPSGCRAVVSAQYASSSVSMLMPTDMAAINEMRSYAALPTLPTYWALGYSMSAAGVLEMRLELYPTPTTADSIRVFYRAGWQTPQGGSDTARIAVPPDWEGVFLEALIAYSMGVEERDVAGVSKRLLEIRQSEMFLYLVRQDGMSQSNFGQLRGGGVINYGSYTVLNP